MDNEELSRYLARLGCQKAGGPQRSGLRKNNGSNGYTKGWPGQPSEG